MKFSTLTFEKQKKNLKPSNTSDSQLTSYFSLADTPVTSVIHFLYVHHNQVVLPPFLSSALLNPPYPLQG